MSRIGKLPVAVPDGVTVTMDGQNITAKGKLGELSMTVREDIKAEMKDGEITVSPIRDTKEARMMYATTRSLINNLVTGVSEGYKKTLELVGVGYRAAAQGKTLNLQLGFSHDVNFPVPEGIKIETPQQTVIEIFGADKQRVGQVAAEIRALRPPEPFKGKGVRYQGEYILRKEGKKK